MTICPRCVELEARAQSTENVLRESIRDHQRELARLRALLPPSPSPVEAGPSAEDDLRMLTEAEARAILKEAGIDPVECYERLRERMKRKFGVELPSAPSPAPPQACPECEGNGWVESVWGEDKRRCPYCGGTGKK